MNHNKGASLNTTYVYFVADIFIIQHDTPQQNSDPKLEEFLAHLSEEDRELVKV